MYNCRVYHYADGKQVRLYLKPIETDKESEIEEEKKEKKTGGVNTERSMYVSMNRTKQAIYGIARANHWDLFLTLTFDRNKIDSSDFDLLKSKSTKWLNNLRRVCPGMRYIIIPELHADGQHWHLHGLLGNCAGLTLKDSGIVKNGRKVYNLENWKYGFSTVSEIESQKKVSGYITKYITKELCQVTKGKRRYWSSKNCLTMENVCEELYLNYEQLESLQKELSENIEYVKSQKIPEAGQVITYLEC